MTMRPPTDISRREFCAAVCAVAAGGGRLLGEEAAGEAATDVPAMINVVAPTGGGKQFWADVWFFHDWRIQRNVLTGHCRLLDGRNRRYAWGTFDACRAALRKIRHRSHLPPMQGKAVVVLHGLFRSSAVMRPLCAVLANGTGYTTFNVGYPTTRGSVGDHARSLDSVIRSLAGISEINFVAHSLGNLVVRHWLKDRADAGRGLPAGQQFGRMVMLAPPNHRPQLAAKLLQTDLAKLLAGPAAEELDEDWPTLEPQLATPPFEFGILTGGKNNDRGYNPLIAGDDDGVVTVESTRLAGARDFRVLPVIHTFIMNDPQVQSYILSFLANGYFESEAARGPILAVADG